MNEQKMHLSAKKVLRDCILTWRVFKKNVITTIKMIRNISYSVPLWHIWCLQSIYTWKYHIIRMTLKCYGTYTTNGLLFAHQQKWSTIDIWGIINIYSWKTLVYLNLYSRIIPIVYSIAWSAWSCSSRKIQFSVT